ncbi:HEPN domain-containing protein [uncultured Thiodictyon sp.]|jgi:hypothetical protein|uniref:HEPN domain-containing protein n=1 Tax=uncultured Thiodictyon sp. TaxID=1846217 RepID=UPI0025E0D1B3|nr:HEPN domain-containing protein [uncultured Thiodictyon sp.]
MDEERARTVRQWLHKAHHDLRSARRLYTDTPPLLDTAAYHCHQAAEKALKGYLQDQGQLAHETGATKPPEGSDETAGTDADWTEFERLAGTWSGKFNRDECYDRPILR